MTAPQRPVLIREVPDWKLCEENRPHYGAFLAAAGVSEAVLDAHAAHLGVVAPTPEQRRIEATDDLIWLFVNLRYVSANLPVSAFIGYVLVAPGPTPTRGAIVDLMGDWDFRPLGWLAAAAGLTPTEYDARQPDPASLVLLAGLRHGPVIGLLAEGLA